jgi:ketosteroid isomerase-like protein
MTAPTTTPTTTADALAAARARNEATWRAAALAMYAGDLEGFLSHWTDTPRYEVAYPIDGLPALIEGRDQVLALYGAFTAAAEKIEVRDVTFHQTDDPDVAFIEETMVADLHGGHRYENRLAMRARFREGRLSGIFEYYGQVAHQQLADIVLAARS